MGDVFIVIGANQLMHFLKVAGVEDEEECIICVTLCWI